MLDTSEELVLEFGNDEEVIINPGTIGISGGYGVVYQGWLLDKTPVAVKFMLDSSRGGRESPKCRQKNAKRFEHEIAMLKRLNRLAKKCPNRMGHSQHPRAWIIPQQFPEFFGDGTYRRRRFYVMEWLEPFEFSILRNEHDRWEFAEGLCESIYWLHQKGYVHCDLKPSNIMCRPGCSSSAVNRYCYVDFGSMHQKEEPGSGKTSRNSLSVVDGVRYSPSTPGYADPLEERHTVFSDIYSIGQILRGMFGGDVPISWARIITRCTNLRLDNRYQSVEELQRDIANMDTIRRGIYAQFKQDETRRRMFRESPEVPFAPHSATWQDVLPLEPIQHGNGIKEWFVADYDYYIDNGMPSNWRLVQADFTAQDELVLHANEVLHLEGDLNFTGKVRGEPGSMVVLSDGATLHNTIATDGGGEVYWVEEGSYLNFRDLAAGGKKAKGIAERVFRTHDDVSYLEFGGPGSIQQLRERDAARVKETPLSGNLKAHLADMVKCSGIHDDKYAWRYKADRP